MVLIKYEHLKNEPLPSQPPLPAPTPPPPPPSPPPPLSPPLQSLYSPPLLLTKYTTNTTPKQQQHNDSDEYYKTRKKISPFKNMTTPFTSSCSFCTRALIVSSPHHHHLIANLACTKYFKILLKYFLFVFMSMFFLLFMVQAYKCVHRFNLNQRDVHASLNTLKLNYMRLNYSSQVLLFRFGL